MLLYISTDDILILITNLDTTLHIILHCYIPSYKSNFSVCKENTSSMLLNLICVQTDFKTNFLYIRVQQYEYIYISVFYIISYNLNLVAFIKQEIHCNFITIREILKNTSLM